MNPLRIGKVDGIRRKVAKSEKIVGENVSGFRTVDDGHEIADIEVLIDLRALVADLGEKAMTNRSRAVKLRGGAIVIKAVNIRRIAKGQTP